MRILRTIQNRLQQSDNFYALAGNVLYAGFSMLTFLLMVRLLDKDIYGRWVIYITAASLLDMLRLGLTGTAAIRLISTQDGLARRRSIAASYHLSMGTSLILGILFWSLGCIWAGSLAGSYYGPVLWYYPLLALANLPFQQATMVCQGAVAFRRLLILRGLNGVLTFAGMLAYILWTPDPTIFGIIWVHLGMNLVSSVLAFAKNWDGWRTFGLWHPPTLRSILHFGKYSTASYVGSNLLRSSDTVIMSLSTAMGAEAIAIYAIPLKFVELIEIPLRSFTMTAFPKLSRALQQNKQAFNQMLSENLVTTAGLLIPILFVLTFFSSPLLILIGGPEYADSRELQQTLVFIITGYILLLPFDRYSGVALFALNKPQLNFWKIWIMLGANIAFDAIAVFVYQSLPLVAVATLLFTLLGIGLGWYYILRETAFPLRSLPNTALLMARKWVARQGA